MSANGDENDGEILDANSKEGTSIGQEGWSGHTVCGYKLLFAFLSSGASLIAFQARQARDIYVLTMRNDANLFAWLYLGATMLGFPAAVLIGYVQAAETFRPLFNRLGCKRGEWGRHAPHVYLCILFAAIGLLMIWNQPNLVNIAISPDNVARTAGNATLIAGYKATFNTLPTEAPSGLDCSQRLVLSSPSINVTVWGTNGHAICEQLISKLSYCWPYPDGERKCVYPDSASNAVWWFFGRGIAMAAAAGLLNIYTAAANELYPWKAERVQVFGLQLLSNLPIIGITILFFALLQNQNELTGAPDGGGPLRLVTSLVGICVMLVTMLSIKPLKEARQPAKDGSLHIKFHEYWTMLFPTKNMYAKDAEAKENAKDAKDNKIPRITLAERTTAVRYLFFMWTAHSCWNGAYLYFNVPYIYYVAQVEPNIRGTWNAVLGLVTVVVTIASAICMGLFFGRRTEERKKLGNKNPQTLAWISNLLCAVWGILSFLAISRPNSTGKYTDNARQFVVAFVIGFILHSPFTFFFPVARGWVLDEDVHSGGGVRREAMYAGLLNIAFNVGLCFVSVLNLLMYNENKTCDSRVAAIYTSSSCQNFIQLNYMVVLPLLKVLIALACYKFPIQGKRLELLYEVQGHTQLALKGTLAEKTVGNKGKGPAYGI